MLLPIYNFKSKRSDRNSGIDYFFYLIQAIIISSEALTPLELRGPHDVANLGFIFGLNEQQGKIWVVK